MTHLNGTKDLRKTYTNEDQKVNGRKFEKKQIKLKTWRTNFRGFRLLQEMSTFQKRQEIYEKSSRIMNKNQLLQ